MKIKVNRMMMSSVQLSGHVATCCDNTQIFPVSYGAPGLTKMTIDYKRCYKEKSLR